MMTFQELVQIGVNNIIVSRANGREMSIYELRLIDQFAKTTYIAMRLQELALQQELEHYEEIERDSDEDPLGDTKPTGNGDHRPRPEV